MLPRSVIKDAVDEALKRHVKVSNEFPVFQLESDQRKFARCCYSSIWRTLLGEWKARLVFAVGSGPKRQTIPAGFDPWIDIEVPDGE